MTYKISFLPRTSTCWSCKHAVKKMKFDRVVECGNPEKKGDRLGKGNRAFMCPFFESTQSEKLVSDKTGILIRNKTSLDLRTQKQWMKIGRTIKLNEKGVLMKPSSFPGAKPVLYYSLEQTQKVS